MKGGARNKSRNRSAGFEQTQRLASAMQQKSQKRRRQPFLASKHTENAQIVRLPIENRDNFVALSQPRYFFSLTRHATTIELKAGSAQLPSHK
jgi:hypothetical protein